MNVFITGHYRIDGPIKHLRGKRALLRFDANNPDVYLAQFDDVLLQEAYGWWAIPKNLFVDVVEPNQEDA